MGKELLKMLQIMVGEGVPLSLIYCYHGSLQRLSGTLQAQSSQFQCIHAGESVMNFQRILSELQGFAKLSQELSYASFQLLMQQERLQAVQRQQLFDKQSIQRKLPMFNLFLVTSGSFAIASSCSRCHLHL